MEKLTKAQERAMHLMAKADKVRASSYWHEEYLEQARAPIATLEALWRKRLVSCTTMLRPTYYMLNDTGRAWLAEHDAAQSLIDAAARFHASREICPFCNTLSMSDLVDGYCLACHARFTALLAEYDKDIPDDATLTRLAEQMPGWSGSKVILHVHRPIGYLPRPEPIPTLDESLSEHEAARDAEYYEQRDYGWLS